MAAPFLVHIPDLPPRAMHAAWGRSTIAAAGAPMYGGRLYCARARDLGSDIHIDQSLRVGRQSPASAYEQQPVVGQ